METTQIKENHIIKMMYLILIERAEILVVLNKLIFTIELITIKEVEQGPMESA